MLKKCNFEAAELIICLGKCVGPIQVKSNREIADTIIPHNSHECLCALIHA